ncbi:MAG: thioredoxin family protein [Actinomycetota bacterium]
MTMQIRVLGPGCVRCHALLANTTEALASLGLDADIEQIDDVTEILARGVLATPALVVNDEVVLAGHVPTASHIRDLLASRAET